MLFIIVPAKSHTIVYITFLLLFIFLPLFYFISPFDAFRGGNNTHLLSNNLNNLTVHVGLRDTDRLVLVLHHPKICEMVVRGPTAPMCPTKSPQPCSMTCKVTVHVTENSSLYCDRQIHGICLRPQEALASFGLAMVTSHCNVILQTFPPCGMINQNTHSGRAGYFIPAS